MEHDNSGDNPKLLIRFYDSDVRQLYPAKLSTGEDSGFDLYLPADIVVPANARGFTIDLQIACEPIGNHGYWLLVRSSISKTPLRLANSVGLIDQGYRGHLKVKLDNLSDQSVTLQKGRRLFQLAMPDLRPFKLREVDVLSTSVRGSGGFGSTGN